MFKFLWALVFCSCFFVAANPMPLLVGNSSFVYQRVASKDLFPSKTPRLTVVLGVNALAAFTADSSAESARKIIELKDLFKLFEEETIRFAGSAATEFELVVEFIISESVIPTSFFAVFKFAKMGDKISVKTALYGLEAKAPVEFSHLLKSIFTVHQSWIFQNWGKVAGALGGIVLIEEIWRRNSGEVSQNQPAKDDPYFYNLPADEAEAFRWAKNQRFGLKDKFKTWGWSSDEEIYLGPYRMNSKSFGPEVGRAVDFYFIDEGKVFAANNGIFVNVLSWGEVGTILHSGTVRNQNNDREIIHTNPFGRRFRIRYVNRYLKIFYNRVHGKWVFFDDISSENGVNYLSFNSLKELFSFLRDKVEELSLLSTCEEILPEAVPEVPVVRPVTVVPPRAEVRRHVPGAPHAGFRWGEDVAELYRYSGGEIYNNSEEDPTLIRPGTFAMQSAYRLNNVLDLEHRKSYQFNDGSWVSDPFSLKGEIRYNIEDCVALDRLHFRPKPEGDFELAWFVLARDVVRSLDASFDAHMVVEAMVSHIGRCKALKTLSVFILDSADLALERDGLTVQEKMLQPAVIAAVRAIPFCRIFVVGLPQEEPAFGLNDLQAAYGDCLQFITGDNVDGMARHIFAHMEALPA